MDAGNEYRLQRISEMQTELKSEKLKREELSSRYRKSLTTVAVAEGILGTSFTGLQTVSLVLLSTIVAAPAVTIMQGASLGAGLLFILGGFITKNLLPRAEKHEKIKLLAEKKLNIISDLVSKALNDGIISDEEYSLILSEINNFARKKERIRSEAKKRIDKQRKPSLVHSFKAKALKLR